MTSDDLDQLRAGASRADYASMARFARALHRHGLGPREVLRECYGVSLPEEVFVITNARPLRPRLLMDLTNQPWLLVLPTERGGLPDEPYGDYEVERELFHRDPDLLPLAILLDADGELGDLVACYRLSDLSVGRTTVFGCHLTHVLDDKVSRLGDSLLEELHRHVTEHLRQVEHEVDQPGNWGAGSLDERNIASARQMVDRVEELQREVAACWDGD
jgi:hypothetical protein